MDIEIEKKDWKQLIQDLIAHGKTQKEIGLAIDRSQPYIADVLDGRYQDVKWTDGQKIIALHKNTFPEAYIHNSARRDRRNMAKSVP